MTSVKVPSPLLWNRRFCAPAGDKEVVEAIVVVVADSDAACPDATPQPGFFGDVGKCAVAIVAVEPDNRFLGRGLQAPAGKQHDIEPPVVVVIEECGAAPHGLEDIGFGIYASVNDRRTQSRPLGHIDEVSMERQSRRFAAGNWLHVSRRHSAILICLKVGTDRGNEEEGQRTDAAARDLFQKI